MRDPRNVTPDAPADVPPAGDDTRGRYGRASAQGPAPEWMAWDWARGGGRRYPWGGILLVLLGGALLLQQLVPGLAFGTIILLGLGLTFGGAWLTGRSRMAVTPAFILLGLGVSALLRDVGRVSGSGWTPLILGIALLALWAVGEITPQRHGWALWVGGILAIIGLAQVSDRIPGFPDVATLWPVLLILIGVVIIFGGRFGPDRRIP
jgi:hypothetical protein